MEIVGGYYDEVQPTCDGKEIMSETRLVTVLRFTDEEVESDAEADAMARQVAAVFQHKRLALA